MTINVGNIEINGVTYDNRCLSASYSGAGIEVDSIPWEGTEYNPWDFKHENDQFILDVIVLPTLEYEPSIEERVTEVEGDIVSLTDSLMNTDLTAVEMYEELLQQSEINMAQDETLIEIYELMNM